MNDELTRTWFDPLFKTEAMRRIFSDKRRLQGMLDFEAALAKALAGVGILSPALAERIATQCRAERFDIPALSKASASAGNSAIPVIHELQRVVANECEEAARYVHFGATSQDAMDTGLVLQIREALALLEGDLADLTADLVRLAEDHKSVLMIGRTWLQHAAFTTFGIKAAGWATAVARQRERIQQLRTRCLVVQLGGPVGTLAAYGDQADRIVAMVAKNLQLGVAELPWHTHRDRLAEVATTLGLVVGTLGKLACDIALLSQSEIAEVAEPAATGRGGSSSMPQKQNPVGCAVVLAAAIRVPALVGTMLTAMPQENERGLGGWQAEWETLPQIFELTAGALAATRHVISGLCVDIDRIIDNLSAACGMLHAESVARALSLKIGRAAAHKLVARASRQADAEGRDFAAVIRDDGEIAAQLSAAELRAALDASQDMQAAGRLVDQVLAGLKQNLNTSESRKEH